MNITKVIYFLFLLIGIWAKDALGQQVFGYFNAPVALGQLQDNRLREVSGMVAASDRGKFWVHNDSGDSARIYLIDDKARLIRSFALESVKVSDCEDIARVVLHNRTYLVLADIGDNLQRRNFVVLYIFPEPQLTDSIIARSKIRRVLLRYPGGKRLDAESIMIDPLSKNLYVVSKREFNATVYSAPVFADRHKNQYRLDVACQLPFTFATAADISTDGRDIVVKNLVEIYYWRRYGRETVESALRRRPQKLPYTPEPQGEAICFDLDGKGFYTLSERPFGLKSYLYFYSKNQ